MFNCYGCSRGLAHNVVTCPGCGYDYIAHRANEVAIDKGLREQWSSLNPVAKDIILRRWKVLAESQARMTTLIHLVNEEEHRLSMISIFTVAWSMLGALVILFVRLFT